MTLYRILGGSPEGVGDRTLGTQSASPILEKSFSNGRSSSMSGSINTIMWSSLGLGDNWSFSASSYWYPNRCSIQCKTELGLFQYFVVCQSFPGTFPYSGVKWIKKLLRSFMLAMVSRCACSTSALSSSVLQPETNLVTSPGCWWTLA